MRGLRIWGDVYKRQVLNNNMGKVPVTEADVADYDIEECTAILNAYMEFVDELRQNPN